MLAKAYIEITNFCGLSCDFCEPKKEKSRNMKISLFEKINKELYGKTKTISYHILGDPFTLQNLTEYLNISAKYEHSVELTTSGHNLGKIDTNTLLHPAVRQINFSLSSHFANNNKNMSIDEYMRHILEFCRKSIDTPKRFVNLRLWNIGDDRYTVFNAEIEQIIKDRFGVITRGDKIKIAPYTILVKNRMFSWPSMQKEAINTKGSCLAIKGQLGFLVDGRVVPCCLDSKGDMELGSIKLQSLDDILLSDRALKMTKGFRENILVEKMCQTCGFREIRL